MGATESRLHPPEWLVEACASLEPVDIDEGIKLCRKVKGQLSDGDTPSCCPQSPIDAANFVLDLESRLGWDTGENDANITSALRDAFATPPSVHAVVTRVGDIVKTRGNGNSFTMVRETKTPTGPLCNLLASLAACRRAASGDKGAMNVLLQATWQEYTSDPSSETNNPNFFEKLIEQLAGLASGDDKLKRNDRTTKNLVTSLALVAAKTVTSNKPHPNSHIVNHFTTIVTKSMCDASVPWRRDKLVPRLVDAKDVPLEGLNEFPENNKNALLTPTAAWFLSRWCPENWRSKWRKVFDSTEHGASFASFITHTKEVGPTLVLVRSESGYVFGGLSSESVKSGSDFFGDERSFVFALGNGVGANSLGSVANSQDESDDNSITYDFGVHTGTGVNQNFTYCASGFTSDRFPNGVGFGGQVGHFCFFVEGNFENGHCRATAATFGGVRLIAGDGTDDNSNDCSFTVSKVEAWAVDGDFQKRLLEKRVLQKRRGANGSGGVLGSKFAETRMLMEVARRDAGGAEREER